MQVRELVELAPIAELQLILCRDMQFLLQIRGKCG